MELSVRRLFLPAGREAPDLTVALADFLRPLGGALKIGALLAPSPPCFRREADGSGTQHPLRPLPVSLARPQQLPRCFRRWRASSLQSAPLLFESTPPS